MAGPVQCIQRGVVFGQGGIAAVAENTFEKIQIADEAAGSEATRLHGFLGVGSSGRTDDGAQQQRGEQIHLLVLIPGEGHGEHVLGRPQSFGQKGREGALGDGDLVGGNCQTAFGDMKDALGGRKMIVNHAPWQHLQIRSNLPSARAFSST